MTGLLRIINGRDWAGSFQSLLSRYYPEGHVAQPGGVNNWVFPPQIQAYSVAAKPACFVLHEIWHIIPQQLETQFS
jgi:hypothetical protein